MGTLNEGSKRLDCTLSSEAFAYKDSVSRLVKNHILKSSLVEDDPKDKRGGKHLDEVTQHWSSKIWTFLDDLRSASAKLTGKLNPTDDTNGHSREWKLKDETGRFRVMYREGPEGTPFHTLCLDGVVDGDFPSGMCVAWEVPLFKEWWPQFMVPTFKISESKWLRRVRVGEDLSLLRFKVPWPLAPREVVMSAFEVEYLEEDLIVGLIESVPAGTTEVNEEVFGYSVADLPPPSSANVRIDIGGGFVMQRTSKDQFFFRTIMNLDMKLDFVPPWLINFISRQVAGQGLKLYQKAVLAASNGTGSGKAFQKPLKAGKMYNRVKIGLEAKTAANGDEHTTHVIERPHIMKDNVKAKSLQGSIRRMASSEYNRVVPYPVKADEIKESIVESCALVTDESFQPLLESHPERHENRTTVEEVKPAERAIEEIKSDSADSSSSQDVQAKHKSLLDEEGMREYEDPEVVWAINILDKMISYNRSCAAEKAASSQSLESQVESISLDSKGADSKKASVKGSRNPHLSPPDNQNCNIVVVKQATASSNTIQKLDTIGSSTSRGPQSAGRDTESSGLSGFWSASEIEVVSSQDDTDTDVGGSGSLAVGQPKVQKPEGETKRRRRKWQWTCFSPSNSHKQVGHGKNNFYARDPGRASEGHWRSLTGNSGRRDNRRDYLTDGDEMCLPTQRVQSQGHSPTRFVTLGALLLANEH